MIGEINFFFSGDDSCRAVVNKTTVDVRDTVRREQSWCAEARSVLEEEAGARDDRVG